MKTIPIILGAAFLQYSSAASSGPVDPCHGVYYKSINTLDISCFYPEDVLINQSMNFYEFQLDTDCYDVTFKDIQPLLDVEVFIPDTLNDSTPLSCCDYYQRTVGYVFTDCD
jgi:hypothetical protein